jgi:uncharacterized protein YbjT (DUF2867 family)
MAEAAAAAHARVVVTGATGYLGRVLAERLIARGHDVIAVVRPGAASRAPRGAAVVEADALTANGVARALAPGDTLVHLVGTPRPSPAKAAEFRTVDLASIVASTAAARQAPAGHVVYVSVAHPAPVMRDYIAVRRQGEALVTATGLPATVLRPWYVLGPGHWWPYALLPLYALADTMPRWREPARRLGLVTWREMRDALVWSVEHPPAAGVHVLDVPAIRATPRSPA